MITLNRTNVETLRHGQILLHTQLTNRDGTPLRARVNGRPQLWVTRPDSFRLPMKHGLRHCFQLTEQTGHSWIVSE